MWTLSCFSRVQLFVFPWTVALQAPLSTGFSRQEYWSGLPCPLSGDLPDLRIEPHLLCPLHWPVGSLPLMPPGKSFFSSYCAQHSVVSLCDPMDCRPPGCSVLEDSWGRNTEVGCHALLQGIFPTQGLNPGLPHYRQILYCLSHRGSPRILEWVAYPFSRGSSQRRNWTGVSCIAGGFFTSWATREAHRPQLSYVLFWHLPGWSRGGVVEIHSLAELCHISLNAYVSQEIGSFWGWR